MLSRVAADVVMGFHFAFLVFLAAGSLLAWRWPRVVAVHVPSVVWGLVSITVGLTCPLTPLEQQLRRSAGEQGYAGGFVDHYIEGVVYPEQYTPLLRALIATAVVAGYVGLLRRSVAHAPQKGSRQHRRLWWRRCQGSVWGRGGHGRNRFMSSDSAPTRAVEGPATVAGSEGNSLARSEIGNSSKLPRDRGRGHGYPPTGWPEASFSRAERNGPGAAFQNRRFSEVHR